MGKWAGKKNCQSSWNSSLNDGVMTYYSRSDNYMISIMVIKWGLKAQQMI